MMSLTPHALHSASSERIEGVLLLHRGCPYRAASSEVDNCEGHRSRWDFASPAIICKVHQNLGVHSAGEAYVGMSAVRPAHGSGHWGGQGWVHQTSPFPRWKKRGPEMPRSHTHQCTFISREFSRPAASLSPKTVIQLFAEHLLCACTVLEARTEQLPKAQRLRAVT